MLELDHKLPSFKFVQKTFQANIEKKYQVASYLYFDYNFHHPSNFVFKSQIREFFEHEFTTYFLLYHEIGYVCSTFLSLDLQVKKGMEKYHHANEDKK